MREKTFHRIVLAILIAGTVSSVSLVAYTVYKHNGASIITYIGNER